ncbi:DUF305 domain-containing protein [Aliidiomarina iranensis]|uniref:DUF305 domain-containing protein n=1 Tax=Aliidiomarina iranensis TaxID=1434071 RepID=A0A432VU41_9GAMM|nr:DUF305 domain-containing protein [Aliidiomarina iranensis]RUO19960.1 DUF305 domain-containing protein [Aliidiomarina iranensis]
MPQARRLFRPSRVLLAIAAASCFSVAIADVPIIQPGKPGEPSRQINAEEAIQLVSARYSAADVEFMQGMLPHHQQALDMSALLPERTSSNEMIELANRIERTQKDEIVFMQQWLRERGEPVPELSWQGGEHDEASAHAEHHGAGHGQNHQAMHGAHHEMKGMATPEQMAALEAASGPEFDRMFLELMIKHHEGALSMVDDLLKQRGSAQVPEMFEFVNDINNDQKAEIDRMLAMLTSYSPDPRAGLTAGFRDAEEAIWNMELLAALPKPAGFYDVENPAGLPASRLRELAADAEGSASDESAEDGEGTSSSERPALLDFANTDMAFSGDTLVVGSYHGFKIFDISTKGEPNLISAVVCPGGQGDVSVVGDLLIMSVEQGQGRLDCGLQGIAGEVSEERFRGLRIFDISDLRMPVQVGAVQTCRGSHTHTVVNEPGEDNRLIVYNSATSFVREDEELEGCFDEDPYRDERTARFRIDVIEIPIDRPQDARIIHSPAVFADPESGNLAGLWERGDHGPGTQTTNETNHCHDITVYPEAQIAAGACSGNGILFDISDPENPTRMDAVVDPGFAYWHSATFSNDGSKVIFTDEWGGGVRPRCRASDPLTWGANAIYDIVDGKLEFRSYYKMPAPQSETENCVAHNGSLLPIPGRDIMVQAWYQGGISVFDFTDSANPMEVAYFDRGPIDEKELVTGGYWSAYWYKGLLYGTEIVRGLDVLQLLPSEYLSANELMAAELVDKGEAFNPQLQPFVSWPQEPVVARAYRDQLERGNNLSSDQLNQMNQLLEQADQVLASGRSNSGLANRLSALAAAVNEEAAAHEGLDRKRMSELSSTLDGIAARVR